MVYTWITGRAARRPDRLALLAPVLALGLIGCPADPEGEGEGEVIEGTCTLGVAAEDGSFVPLEQVDKIEILVGFQGFIWIELLALVEPECPDVVGAQMGIVIDDQDPVYAGQTLVPLHEVADGAFVTEDLLLFLNGGSVGQYKDKGADIALALEASGWRCTASGTTLLVDDDPCVMAGDDTECE